MEAEAVSIKHALAGKRARENGTHDRDTVAADARVALEDDIAALVDGKAVILVVDGAGTNTSFSKWLVKHQKGNTPNLSWMVRFVVLQSKPSVLWPAAFLPLLEFGWSPSASSQS